MREFLRRLGATLTEIFTSKKALYTIGTVAAHAFIKDEGLRQTVLVAGATLVGAQGVADFGKSRALGIASGQAGNQAAARAGKQRNDSEAP